MNDRQKSPYECYWSRRALEAEKQLVNLKAHPVADCPVCGRQPTILTPVIDHLNYSLCCHCGKMGQATIWAKGESFNAAVVAWNEACAAAKKGITPCP
jgi:hypothetical protein